MQETIVIRYHYGSFISLLIETENKIGRCPHSAISSLHQTLHHYVQKCSAVHLLFAPINEWNIPLFRIPAEKFLIPMLSWMQTWSFQSRQSLLFTYSNNYIHSSCPHPSPFWGDAMRASPAQREVLNHRGGSLKYESGSVYAYCPLHSRERERNLSP